MTYIPLFNPPKKKTMPTDKDKTTFEGVFKKMQELGASSGFKVDNISEPLIPDNPVTKQFMDEKANKREFIESFMQYRDNHAKVVKELDPIINKEFEKIHKRLDALNNKLDLIFGNHILIDGKFKDVKL